MCSATCYWNMEIAVFSCCGVMCCVVMCCLVKCVDIVGNVSTVTEIL